MTTESSLAKAARFTMSNSRPWTGAAPIAPSAVERLIASRIAAARRDAAAELASARARLHGARSAVISPPTVAERATFTFVAWVRSREPDFFASAPTISGECRFLARLVYEQRLEAYGRAWSTKPSAGHQAQQELMFK
jgi:hypothetical protein